jgi:MFS transporter, DHA1 family, inner membrane transport protein
MSMITASVASRYRGGLMSANSAVQHVSAGVGAYIGGQILIRATDGALQRFNLVGLVSVAATLFSLWLAGRVKSTPNIEVPTLPRDDYDHS